MEEQQLADEPLVSRREVARILGVTPRHVTALESRGELVGAALGKGPRGTRFRPADVRELVARKMNRPAPAQ